MAHLAVGEGRHGVPREELGGERREKYCAYSTRPLARLPAGSRREAEAGGYSNARSRWFSYYRSRSAAGHSKFDGFIPAPERGRAQLEGTASSVD